MDELERRKPGATLRESMPGLPPGIPHPVFIPRNSDVNTSAGSVDNPPEHYRGNGIQTFDVWDAYDMDRYRASAFKYFTRAKKKGSERNDLEKLIHYIDESIKRLPSYEEEPLDPADISISPEVVIQSFDLDGLMADAAMDFLLSFTTPHPKTYLRAAKAQVEEYLFTID